MRDLTREELCLISGGIVSWGLIIDAINTGVGAVGGRGIAGSPGGHGIAGSPGGPGGVGGTGVTTLIGGVIGASGSSGAGP